MKTASHPSMLAIEKAALEEKDPWRWYLLVDGRVETHQTLGDATARQDEIGGSVRSLMPRWGQGELFS